MRGLLLATLAVLAHGLYGAEPATTTSTPITTSVGGYHFTAKSSQVYAYSLKQNVAWSSAGDKLSYTSTLTWKFLLTVSEATSERAVLDVTILRVQATHEGPGSRRAIDSGAKEQDGGDDPLLGHLLALSGASLQVVMVPASGQVSEVRGGDTIVARISKRAPSATPGDPSPLEAAAKTAFSSEALSRLWNQLLAQPSSMPTRVPLGPPLGGEVERTWQGNDFTLRLPAGSERLQATLVGDPTPVVAALSELTGSGSASIIPDKGLPGAGKGSISFQLTFQALTQPVTQHHTLSWELTPLKVPTP